VFPYIAYSLKFNAEAPDGNLLALVCRVREYLTKAGLEEFKDFQLTYPAPDDTAPVVRVSMNNQTMFLIAKLVFGGK
jgi:hypothetical protein